MKENRKEELLNIGGSLLKIERPWVMGILNLTPDSFYPESRTLGVEEALEKVAVMIDEGVDIIDIGACSTRPGSETVGEEEEIRRLGNTLPAVREAFPDVILSVDTFRSSVAEMCLEKWGVNIINDVSGGRDERMFETIARNKAVYVLMHTRGNPSQMDSLCNYPRGVVTEVLGELAVRLHEARKAGVCDVIIDPGFGFAKNIDQNYELLTGLDRLKVLGCPILAALSRKRMVREVAGCGISDSLAPTVALNAAAIMKGASIIRVHDVREGVATVKTIGKCLTSD